MEEGGIVFKQSITLQNAQRSKFPTFFEELSVVTVDRENCQFSANEDKTAIMHFHPVLAHKLALFNGVYTNQMVHDAFAEFNIVEEKQAAKKLMNDQLNTGLKDMFKKQLTKFQKNVEPPQQAQKPKPRSSVFGNLFKKMQSTDAIDDKSRNMNGGSSSALNGVTEMSRNVDGRFDTNDVLEGENMDFKERQ